MLLLNREGTIKYGNLTVCCLNLITGDINPAATLIFHEYFSILEKAVVFQYCEIIDLPVTLYGFFSVIYHI